MGKPCLQRVERQGIRAILNQLRDRVAPSDRCGVRLLTPISARNEATFACMESCRLPSNGPGVVPAFDRNTAFHTCSRSIQSIAARPPRHYRASVAFGRERDIVQFSDPTHVLIGATKCSCHGSTNDSYSPVAFQQILTTSNQDVSF